MIAVLPDCNHYKEFRCPARNRDRCFAEIAGIHIGCADIETALVLEISIDVIRAVQIIFHQAFFYL